MARAAKKRTKRTQAKVARRRATGETLHRGKTAAERRAERRERLLATGLELFGTLGYGETTIEGICAHAHVTARHFYEEFDSREALLMAVYDRVVAQGMGAVTVALEQAPADDPLARARAAVRAFVDSMLDDPRRARVQCVQVVGVSAEMERHRRRVLRMFAGLLEREARELARRGLIAERPFHIGAMAFVAGINELVIEALEAPRRFPKDAIVEESVVLLAAAAGRATAAS
ncbi:MAG: TetR/AcrR family transcriptional regulator [Myxococcota bacterium]